MLLTLLNSSAQMDEVTVIHNPGYASPILHAAPGRLSPAFQTLTHLGAVG